MHGERRAADVRAWDCASLTQVRAKGAKVPGQGASRGGAKGF